MGDADVDVHQLCKLEDVCQLDADAEINLRFRSWWCWQVSMSGLGHRCPEVCVRIDQQGIQELLPY